VSKATNAKSVRTGPVRSVAIVGAGDCGTRVALALREHGFSGDVTLFGDEPGDPYERPTLSKAVISDDTPPPLIATSAKLKQLDIHLSNERVKSIDPSAGKLTLAGGTFASADRLVLATGARARKSPLGEEFVHTVRSLTDAQQLRAQLNPGSSVVVIGGGFVGLELAAAATQRGCNVTVVEFAHRLMARVVPARVSDVIRERHEQAGVSIRTGSVVSTVWTDGGTHSVRLGDGTTLRCDAIIAGLGAIPNTELAARAGLVIDNGIAVNECLQTSNSHVYAAGDCCSFPYQLSDGKRVRLESWRNAIDQAEVVALNIIGIHTVYTKVPWFWSDQYDLQLQVAGLHEEATSEVLRPLVDGTQIWFGINSHGRLVSASGVGTGTALGRTISVAERLISQCASPSPATLADAETDLRKLISSR
jgi:3-phenylpropionate/trans-cinnamate dioxygenase ferredoxin reductase component